MFTPQTNGVFVSVFTLLKSSDTNSMKDVLIVSDEMDSGMWQEAVSSLVKENNRLTEKLMLLEDTNAMLSSECRRLGDELARRSE